MTHTAQILIHTEAQQQAVADISTVVLALRKVALTYKYAPVLLVDCVKQVVSDDLTYLQNAMNEDGRTPVGKSVAQLVLEGVRGARHSTGLPHIAYSLIRESLAVANDDFTERYMSSILSKVYSALQDIRQILEILSVIYAQYGNIQVENLTTIRNAVLSVREDVLSFQYVDRGGLISYGNVLFVGVSTDPIDGSVKRHMLEAPPGRDYIRMTVGKFIPGSLYVPTPYSSIVRAFRFAYNEMVTVDRSSEHAKFDADAEIQKILGMSNLAYSHIRQAHQFATPLFSLFNEFVNSVFGVGLLDNIQPAKAAASVYNEKCFSQAQLLQYLQPTDYSNTSLSTLETLSITLKTTLRLTGEV